MGRTGRDRLFTATAVAVVLLGVFVNFFRLNEVSALSDEPGYAAAAWRYVHGTVGPAPEDTQFTTIDNNEHPPLAKLLFGLAQLVVGRPSITADRAVAAGCVVLAALILGLWLGRIASRWIGLTAMALMLLLPQAVAPLTTRFSRTGTLDPVAELFMVVSIVSAWYWFARAGRRGWYWAVATGVAVGLASASKENGFLGVIGPVILGLALTRGWGQLRTRAAQSVLAVALSVAVFIASYLPLGAPLGRISFLWQYQLSHAGHGHLIGFAGRVSAEPPWWANFWFAGYGIGVLTSIALLIAAVVAVALVRQRPTWTLASALAAPVLFHTVLAPVTLPFYWTMWLPAFLGLAAIGLAELARRATTATGRTRWRLAAAASAVVLSAPIVWSVGSELHTTAVITPVGPIAIPAVLESNDVDGKVAIAGLYQAELEPYVESSRLVTSLPAAASAQAVIIGQPRCRTLVDLGIQALVATNLANRSLVPVYSDRLLVIYRVVGTLTIPTPADIAAQPTRRVEDDC